MNTPLQNLNASELSDTELQSTLVAANDAYRNTSSPIMDDEVYDRLVVELTSRSPEHPLLTTVEPEADFGLGKVRHRSAMLSTLKVYEGSELQAWLRRVEEAAEELGMDTPVSLIVNAKLDGMAGRLENGVLASRGDGMTGNDITHMLPKGLLRIGESDGDGELVMPQHYFDEHLADEFSHPRNVVTGAVGADTPRPAAQKALRDNAIHFVRYDTLPTASTHTDTIETELPDIRQHILGQCDYPTDGLIIVVESPELRAFMGATNSHQNWMVASKTRGETATTTVTGLLWAVGRTGRLTPVIKVKPTLLTGAMISNVTGHHAGNVEKMGIGPGATATITRSGDVIPYLVDCSPAPDGAELPTHCPECASELKRRTDFLVCDNTSCDGRAHARLHHFFHTIGSIDLFGPVACDKLIAAGIRSIEQVFEISKAEFESMGFGPGQSANLVRELHEACTRPVDDFRVLAAMGVSHLGRGDSRKLLRHFPLRDIPTLSAEQIASVHGFGVLTANSIANTLPSITGDLMFLERTLTGIVATEAQPKTVSDSPISGKHIVFTGAMLQGSRPDMIAHAESLGAISQSGVNKKTSYLVAGEKVGASKLGKAEKLGTIILSESEYLAMING